MAASKKKPQKIETIPDEFLSKFKDQTWRLENLYRIITKKSENILFKQNKIQRLINQSTSKKKIILKARQFGVTTNEILKRFDSAIWNYNKNICIIAHKRDILDKIFSIVRYAYEKLPVDIKPALDRGGGSMYEYRFPELNSSIYVALEVRGGTVNELHISEAAFIDHARIQATLQSVPVDGLVTIESTPNGLNHFYDMYVDGNNGYEKFFFPWFLHDDYRLPTKDLDLTEDEINLVRFASLNFTESLTYGQIAFRRNKIKTDFLNKKQQFLKEYPEDDATCFLSSGSNPFDANILQRIKLINDPKNFQILNGIKIAKKKEVGNHYVISADPAEGVKKDFSVAFVICVETGEDVAIFRGQLKPSDFAEKLYEIAELYATGNNWPLLIVERNNHGHAVILKLDETLGYPNLWLDDDERIGHRTTAKSRPLMIDEFVDCLEYGIYKTNFNELINECLTLVDNDGKIEADTGKNDDCVMAYALGIKAANMLKSEITLYSNLQNKILV